MGWSQHGEYQLQWQGDILVARYIGAWNEIASKNLHGDALKLWAARGNKPWGLLSDASQWGGGSQECLDAWWDFFDDGIRHGMIAVTDILPSEVHAMIVSPMAKRASQLIPYKRSFSIPEAIQWMEEKGLHSTEQG